MVKAEMQMDGRTKLTGRNSNEVIFVNNWPCSRSEIVVSATKQVPRKWIDECIAVSNDLRELT